MGPRRLVFPQGKEEICKEEVVESPGAVAESRQVDLQKEDGGNSVSVTAMWPRGGRQETEGKGPGWPGHEVRGEGAPSGWGGNPAFTMQTGRPRGSVWALVLLLTSTVGLTLPGAAGGSS